LAGETDMEIRFSLNGRNIAVETAPERRVVDLLREDLALTGTKEGCGSGECGACTVLIDGGSRLSCLMVAAQLAGRRVTTIEGLANGKGLHPLQESFVRSGAVQCGFCSPGMILTASALLADNPHPSREAIRAGLSGNLCRCTGYQKIVDAVAEAAATLAGTSGPRTKGTDRVARLKDASHRPSSSSFSSIDAGESTEICNQTFPLLDQRPGKTDGPDPETSGARSGGGGQKRKGNPEILLPRTLPELFAALAAEPQARLFAGGTDLFVHLRAGDGRPPLLIGLEKIVEIQGIRDVNGSLWIGAGTPHSQLIADPLIRTHLPVLAQALATLGSPPIRHMGTIGGNLCTASPAGDTLPPLFVLGAEVDLLSDQGERQLPIAAFLRGPGVTSLRPGEILSGIRIPRPPAGTRHHFEKIGQRRALACAIASLAALLTLSPSGTIEAVRLAWGSVAPVVWTSPDLEAALRGRRLDSATLEAAAQTVRSGVSPISDGRATANYRREVAGNLLLRLLDVAESSGGLTP